MQQQVAVITLGIGDLARAGRFYREGFGWTPVYEGEDILFYQMNGFVLGLWAKDALAQDMRRPVAGDGSTAPFALAHNVATQAEVAPLIARLVEAGGELLRAADAPPHGGMRGYVADPDGHAWEIAWNPAWPIDAEGRVTFAL
ncbi:MULTISPECIES: VOC family protein [Sphingobium]|uniref:VOC family protein n=1 Tax=Sphingobium TaxID=165695 RepID=UPI0015EC1255|nr:MULTISPECIES: VOC family protein [Sphingobium]MCW2364087.1 catechol 2,3-dioxygenase-like lactoylglutathione lyase family enzyme [Sphingobium sp. B10D3B]MCW2402516.1 catechol 2,3-dioxygenase-like lactoylglutathione lyase family enzyme [Sphingobium sp. B10D7B]MCW2409495.1 catechol 2,3-dioxygenase-like lactoylglutathione lyase family enzyme [Sphingobium xanthum]